MKSLSFELRVVPPSRLDLIAWALRRRPHNTTDRWDGTSWRRVLMIDDEPLETAITQPGTSGQQRLKVALSSNRISENTKGHASRLLRRMFGLRTDLSVFYSRGACDKPRAPLAQRFRGLEPSRFPSVFEGPVNALAGQQLSLTAGIWALNRLPEKCGPTVHFDGPVQHGFPPPTDTLRLDPDSLCTLGFSFAKARSLLELTQAAEARQLDQEDLNNLNADHVLGVFMNLRGIGGWTAQYILLRGLGRIDVSPGGDVSARNRLEKWLGRDQPINYKTVRNAVRQ